MHSTTEKFKQTAKKEFGIKIHVKEFPKGTKTAQDAAGVVGCDVSQIAKSIAMEVNDRIVIVVTSGSNRVSEEKLSDIFDIDKAKIEMADPKHVKEKTGWSIGGVPPFCHKEDLEVLIDKDLMKYDTVWAAAGTPKAIFPINPDKLKEYSNGEIVDIAKN